MDCRATSSDGPYAAQPQDPAAAVAAVAVAAAVAAAATVTEKSQDGNPQPPPPPSSSSPSSAAIKEDWERERDHAKQQGDQAFRMGGYRTAIDWYSQAIELDPDFVVAYSNRSAAYLKNNEKSKALRDAETVVERDPGLAKGWSRLAAALHALKRWPLALEAYQKVLERDAINAVAKKGLVDCQTEMDKAEAYRKRFEEEESPQEEVGGEVPPDDSQNNEPEQENEEEEDDLLNGFFEEVEEVTKKKIEPEPKVAATNKVKNEKETLGSANEQMDRLLQANFEWRNLNPYYVLQLPHTATEDEINRRYKALSVLLHPDKNRNNPRAQLAFEEVKKAKNHVFSDRARHSQMLVEEGNKRAEALFKENPKGKSLEELKEKEVMRIFADIEHKRREVEDRERKFEQRTQQQEDEQEAKERQARQFDKSWRNDDRVHNRVGDWRDFAQRTKKPKL